VQLSLSSFDNALGTFGAKMKSLCQWWNWKSWPCLVPVGAYASKGLTVSRSLTKYLFILHLLPLASTVPNMPLDYAIKLMDCYKLVVSLHAVAL